MGTIAGVGGCELKGNGDGSTEMGNGSCSAGSCAYAATVPRMNTPPESATPVHVATHRLPSLSVLECTTNHRRRENLPKSRLPVATWSSKFSV